MAVLEAGLEASDILLGLFDEGELIDQGVEAENRPRAPWQMQARAMATARCVLPVRSGQDQAAALTRCRTWHAALTFGIERLDLFDIMPERAEQAAQSLRPFRGRPHRRSRRRADCHGRCRRVYPLHADGMAKRPGIGIAADLLRTDLWVAEIVYFPLVTELVRTAWSLGCWVANGGGMAAFQAIEGFRLFTGITPAHFAE